MGRLPPHPQPHGVSMTKAKSSLAQALQVHGDAVEHVEALYLEQSGEVTEASEQAEQARDLAAGDALEELARYRQWVTDQQQALTAECARIYNLMGEFERRAEWSDDRMAGLVRASDPTATKRRAGTRTVRLRDHYSVQAAPDLDLEQLPPHWLRDVPGKPAVPPSVALAKTAAKKDLRAGWQTGEPPGPGWYEVVDQITLSAFSGTPGSKRVYLWQGLTTMQWRFARAFAKGRPVNGKSLAAAGYSIEPKPGLDQLRWRHHAPGVELRCRVGVKVV